MPIFFVEHEKRVSEFIDEYREYIAYVCKKREYLKHNWEDMEQFIIMELIKTYHKRAKYDDFDWVVRSIIRRKAIDFSCYFIRRNKNLVFENQYNSTTDNESGKNQTDIIFNERSVTAYDNKEDGKEILEFLQDLQEKIINKDKFGIFFTDWDREYIEVIFELYHYGNDIKKEDIMECMGFDKKEISSFNSKILSFRNRLEKHLGIKTYNV